MSQPAQALQVVNLQDAALVPLGVPEVKDRIGRYLKRAGSEWEPDDLLLGMADLMTHTPALKRCTPTSLFSALIYAAQRGLNFGMGGVWLQPRDISDPSVPKAERANAPKLKTAVCVMDYRAMEAIAEKRCGIVLPVSTIFVYKDEPAEVVMERGVIVDIRHKIDPARNRTQVDFLWGYTVALRKDGSAPFIYIMDKQSLDKRRKIGASDGDAWTNWGVEMYSKTLERKAMTVLVKDFTAGVAGEGGDYETGMSADPLDITEESNRLTQTEQLQKDLQKQTAEPVKPAPAQAQGAAEGDSPFAGYRESAVEEIILSIANKGNDAKDAKSLKVLMDWWKGEWPKWQKQGTAAQCEAFIKVRDETLATLQQAGVK